MHPPITHRRCRITRTLDPRKIAKQCVINITWVRWIREIRVRDLLIRDDGLRRRITRRRNAAMLGELRCCVLYETGWKMTISILEEIVSGDLVSSAED